MERTGKIEIIPDLSQDLSIDIKMYSYATPPDFPGIDDIEVIQRKTDSVFQTWLNGSPELVNAYPIFIRNSSNDSLHIDNQDGHLFMIQKAKDPNGIWRPIEYWTYSTCGNSYGYTSIGPNDIIVIKKIRHQGPFGTKLRLKIKNNNKIVYSKPFDGSIHVEQFEFENIESWTKKRLEDKYYRERIFFNK
ncbi:hypothetical protein [Costertonia aggregata]|uniref:Uncharacterized protein n=1 Tax=Costertonia aggregata TaxID=343403 RepID=A0A7H9AM65_9FLAO|nr:hypothetical protein [Costertonia aggregata]QLG44463.1 hypothetical protein HYG79_03575 [Costertonia aggregata]